MRKWFDTWWWRYLLATPDRNVGGIRDWIHSIWCRLANHPAGIIYYNPQGMEPDYRCRNCGDELG